MTDAALPDPPALPARLPCGLTREQVEAWVASVDALPDGDARTRACADALDAAVTFARYLRGWRAFHGSRLYVAGATVRACAKAARVADSYVSRQVRRLGLEGRRQRREKAT